MKLHSGEKQKTIADKIAHIERIIKRLGVCTLRNEKLTAAELAQLREHFTIEQVMGYTKFTKK